MELREASTAVNQDAHGAAAEPVITQGAVRQLIALHTPALHTPVFILCGSGWTRSRL